MALLGVWSFNDAVGILEYIPSMMEWLMNDELKEIWRETFLA